MAENEHPSAEQPDSREYFRHSEYIQYEDGSINLQFGVPGDALQFAPDSKFKYGDDVLEEGLGGRAVIRTASGNSYGIGDGLVFNELDETYFHHGLNKLELTIGEEAHFPDHATTTPVTTVEIQYKIGPPGSTSYQQRPGTNPLQAIEEKIAMVRKHEAGLEE